MTRALFAVLIVLALGEAADAAEAAKGEVLAKRWCAACHVVAPDQAGAATQAPPFSEVAAKPGFNTSALALFLLAPHPKMPDMSLTRAEAADLAAYIATQKN